MKHNHLPLNLYRTPFTPAYWREASAAMSSLKLLVFAALMVAVTFPSPTRSSLGVSFQGRCAPWCVVR